MSLATSKSFEKDNTIVRSYFRGGGARLTALASAVGPDWMAGEIAVLQKVRGGC